MSRTPQVLLSYSDDGGHTWSAESSHNLVGADKNYQTRIIWTGLGSSVTRRFKIRCSENINFTCVSASAELSVGV